MTPDQRRHHNDVHASLVNEIINELSKRADCMVWKGRAGTFRLPRGDGWVDVEPIGIPDVVGVTTGGRWVLIEVKTGDAVLSKAQRSLKAQFELLGAVWCTARSVADAVAYVGRLVKP